MYSSYCIVGRSIIESKRIELEHQLTYTIVIKKTDMIIKGDDGEDSKDGMSNDERLKHSYPEKSLTYPCMNKDACDRLTS